VEKDEPLKLELAAFAECASLSQKPRVGGAQAAVALEIAMLITEQIAKQNAQQT
jgi:hypothetical protein